jgi:hypothetical protein
MFQSSPDTQDSTSDAIQLGNEYYIRARSTLLDNQTRVLMRDDMFAVFVDERIGPAIVASGGEPLDPDMVLR